MEHSVYRLAIFLSLFFTPEKADELISDYTEYLQMKDPARQAETPWEFFKPSFEKKHYILLPRKKFLVVPLLFILLLMGCTWRIQYDRFIVQIIRLSMLCLSIPLVTAYAFDCRYISRFDTKRSKNLLFLCLPPLLTILPACLIWYAVQYFYSCGLVGVAAIFMIHDILRFFRGVSILFLFVSVYFMLKKSVLYLCSFTEFLAVSCALHALRLMLTSFANDSIPYRLRILICFIPFVLGVMMSLFFALRISQKRTV